MGSTITERTENSKSVDDTMYHPSSATADCIADMLHKGEGGPFTNVFTAGSPSSECPSLREGPPQKGKIGQNMVQYTTNRLAAMRNPDGTCDKCSYCQDGYCYQWHMQIHMPHIPCGYWSTESSFFTTLDNVVSSPSRIIARNGLAWVENPNGYWEPIKSRSCTNCKLYNDPICMKMETHIGTRQEILAKEEENGFLCFAADQL